MTNLEPKHIDALVERQRQIAILHRGIIESHKDTIRGPLSLSVAEHRELIADASRAADTITALRAENDRLSNLWQIEHDHATALRAQIDRERAATIEAAGRVAWPHPWQPDHLLASASYVLFCAANHIRALHTDATRAAMDAIWREGYEAGAVVERAKSADLANAARDLADCCQLGEDADWEEGEDPLSELRAVLAARS